MSAFSPLGAVTGTVSGAASPVADASSPTSLPPVKTVTATATAGQANGDPASGGSADQGRDSFEQKAAALLRKPINGVSRAAPASIIDAQTVPAKDPFERVALPDPLPTAPILKHLSKTEG